MANIETIRRIFTYFGCERRNEYVGDFKIGETKFKGISDFIEVSIRRAGAGFLGLYRCVWDIARWIGGWKIRVGFNQRS